MRHLTLFVASMLVACNTAVAQPGTEPEAVQPDPAAVAASPRVYLVEVSEYRLAKRLEGDLPANEIVERLAQLKKDGAVDRIQTVLLSALDGQVSFVRFSKKPAVTVGSTRDGLNQENRQTEERTAETQFELLAQQEGEQVRIRSVYRASRFEADGPEASPASTSSVNIETTLLLDLEKPVLIGGLNAESPAYITLTIHR